MRGDEGGLGFFGDLNIAVTRRRLGKGVRCRCDDRDAFGCTTCGNV